MTVLDRVLVGVDGSEGAATALRWAAGLAVATGAELMIATAWSPTQAEASPPMRSELRAAAQAQLDGPWAAPARALGARTRTRLVEGDSDRLLALADAEDSDLIVVGPRGVGGFAALHLGSVAHHLARHTTRPLAIVPAGSREAPPGRIVVGVDGSPGAAAAVQWCAEVAPVVGATVTAVSAVYFEQLWELDGPKADANERDISWARARHNIEAWARPLRDRGVPGEEIVAAAVHPVAALADTAAKLDADLLVVGTHGLGGFPGMRLGGVAVQLVHHLHRPVTLVPPRASTSPSSRGAPGDAP